MELSVTAKKTTKLSKGQPTKYKKEYDELAYNYCLLGAVDATLAEFFGVTETTINNWKIAHPNFFESIKRGRVHADAKVAASLFGRATGYSHQEEKVFNNQGEIITHQTIKHYAPDPTSMIFWLKNRQPELWRDKQEVEQSGGVTHGLSETLADKLFGGSKK